MTEDFDKLVRRMDMAERNAADVARTLGEIVSGTAAIDGRVRALENIQQDRRVSDVERSGREQSMQKDIKSIEERMGKIETGINKVLWGLAGTVGIAFVGFVLRGGLSG
jgi:hypothetical protein